MPWLYLVGAIITEVCGTLCLRAVANSLTWWAVAMIVVAYGLSFTCMTMALRSINVGVVYAVWSAAGIATISVAGLLLFGDRLSWRGVAGLVIIVIGVAVVVTSGNVHHSSSAAADQSSASPANASTL